jgi:hypothetical protein
MVIGYLPVDAFRDVPDLKLRSILKGELFHRSMEAIFEPLKTASREGVEMWCADGRLRRVYPILASWVGDWPEQNDVACTIRSGCPICKQKFKNRGSGRPHEPMRNREETLAALREYERTKNMTELRRHGLKPWWPFWAELPHVNIAACITPDMLHQLHKGLFKTHMMSWIEELMDEGELDSWFEAMPCVQDLRYFRRGITTVSQWTGRETKEMMKQFLPIAIGNPSLAESDETDFIELVRALLDFSYLAHSARLTEVELSEMEEALDTFHRLKEVVVRLDVLNSQSKFDYIPKLHMVGHYSHFIREFGTPDGYNSETPESLHIEYAKKGWLASNRRNPIPQIIRFVQRREAIKIHRAYLNEILGIKSEPTVEDAWGFGIDMGGGGDDSDDESEDEQDDTDDEEKCQFDAEEEISAVAYPRPERLMALQPTRARLRGTTLINDYGATELMLALKHFLNPRARAVKQQFYIDPSDSFDVWHKISLYHLPLPFAPDEPPRRDVVRAQPPNLDRYGRLQRDGVFDTALFLKKPREFGLHRKYLCHLSRHVADDLRTTGYRACRVRTIFTLPHRLRHFYPAPVAYIELFTRFDDPVSSVHHMHTISKDFLDGRRRALIIPVSALVMSCHLAPDFNRIHETVELGPHVDILTAGRHFFLNHYFNHFFFLFTRYWRCLC